MHDLDFRTQGFHRNGKLDDAMAALRKQMFEASLEERKRAAAVRPPQQLGQLVNAWGRRSIFREGAT